VLRVTVRLMSDGELSRLEVLRDLDQKRLTTEAAARLLGLERRQVFRLLKAYRTEGATGLIPKRRGRRSNRRKPEALRRAALALIREWYCDFGPTLAAEKLREVHGITLGRETLRLWMIEAGLWRDRRQRRKRVHQPRYRRDCVGDLVQVDGCEHWWFEDRGPQCTLLVFIDDAAGRLMHLQFVESQSTFVYFHATRAYLEAWGKPVAFYSDKHGVFRVNQRGALGGDGMTQFGRALHALNIDIICANSSQAKGRVERAHKTLQDRLVKELRLAGASSLAEGNALLPAFIADYNARFGKPPANKKDLHRPLHPGDDLEDAFAWKEERTLSQALTLQYDKVMFILQPSEQAKAAIGKRVTASIILMVQSVTAASNWRIGLRQNSPSLAGRDRREQTARCRACRHPRGAAASRPQASQWTAPARSARRASL
jgi:Winged helix-turn helix